MKFDSINALISSIANLSQTDRVEKERLKDREILRNRESLQKVLKHVLPGDWAKDLTLLSGTTDTFSIGPWFFQITVEIKPYLETIEIVSCKVSALCTCGCNPTAPVGYIKILPYYPDRQNDREYYAKMTMQTLGLALRTNLKCLQCQEKEDKRKAQLESRREKAKTKAALIHLFKIATDEKEKQNENCS